jgi:hypothetical protein
MTHAATWKTLKITLIEAKYKIKNHILYDSVYRRCPE